MHLAVLHVLLECWRFDEEHQADNLHVALRDIFRYERHIVYRFAAHFRRMVLDKWHFSWWGSFNLIVILRSKWHVFSLSRQDIFLPKIYCFLYSLPAVKLLYRLKICLSSCSYVISLIKDISLSFLSWYSHHSLWCWHELHPLTHSLTDVYKFWCFSLLSLSWKIEAVLWDHLNVWVSL